MLLISLLFLIIILQYKSKAKIIAISLAKYFTLLTSPLKPHAFVSLTLQSNFLNTLQKGFKYFTFLKFCTGVIILVVVMCVKFMLFGTGPISLWEGGFLGLVALISRLSGMGWVEMFLNYTSLEYYLYILWHGNNHGDKMYLDSNSPKGEIKKFPIHLNRNGSASDSGEGTSNDKITTRVSTPEAVVEPEPSSQDLADKTNKESFPSTGPDGCLELKAELKRLINEPSNLPNSGVDDQLVKDDLKKCKNALVDYNPKELLHLERVRDYFHALDNNQEASTESIQAYKIRQKRYLDQVSEKGSWKGPPVDFNNPANVRLVAEQDLEGLKVANDWAKIAVKTFEQAGYNPDMDKYPSVSEFIKLNSKAYVEHSKNYEEFYNNKRIKEDQHYDTWSKHQLEYVIKAIKKQEKK